jgi:ABC-type Fe3+ transport system substrate-binding protein
MCSRSLKFTTAAQMLRPSRQTAEGRRFRDYLATHEGQREMQAAAESVEAAAKQIKEPGQSALCRWPS